MRIPNKFNGYSADNRRLYNDPATATVTLASMGETAAGVGALETGLAAGATIAGGTGLAGIVGGMGALAPEVAGSALSALAPTAAAEIAPAAVAQAAGTIAPSAAQTVGLDALKNQVISQGVNTAAANQATNLAVQNAIGQNVAGGIANAGTGTLANAGNNAAYNQLLEAFSNPAPRFVSPEYELVADASANTPLVQKAATQPSSLVETLRNANTALNGPAQISYAEGAQGLAPNAAPISTGPIVKGTNFLSNAANFIQNPSWQAAKDYAAEHPYVTSAGVGLAAKELFSQDELAQKKDTAYIRPYSLDVQNTSGQPYDPNSSAERNQITYNFTPGTPYKADGRMASGGIADAYAVGGPVEMMSAQNAVGDNTMYPQAGLQTSMYSNPMMQRPVAQNVITSGVDTNVDPYTGEQRMAAGGFAEGGFNPADPMGNQRSQGLGTSGPVLKKSPGYDYSYDPKTMQFTQTSAPVKVEGKPLAGMGGQYGGQSKSGWASTPTNVTSGGIAGSGYQPQGANAAGMGIPAYQTPEQQMGLQDFYGNMDAELSRMGYAAGGMTEGHLGGYSDGGRLLKGPGDGVSDSIPAVIGHKQPARLADGEFVVPARIVSELGNGSTEAGARKLYAMMDRVQKARGKSVGKGKVAVNSKADKHLPA